MSENINIAYSVRTNNCIQGMGGRGDSTQMFLFIREQTKLSAEAKEKCLAVISVPCISLAERPRM